MPEESERILLDQNIPHQGINLPEKGINVNKDQGV